MTPSLYGGNNDPGLKAIYELVVECRLTSYYFEACGQDPIYEKMITQLQAKSITAAEYITPKEITHLIQYVAKAHIASQDIDNFMQHVNVGLRQAMMEDRPLSITH